MGAREFCETYLNNPPMGVRLPKLANDLILPQGLLECVHLDSGLWEYKIPDKTYGPFSNKQMYSWRSLGRLPPALPVRRKKHEKLLVSGEVDDRPWFVCKEFDFGVPIPYYDDLLCA